MNGGWPGAGAAPPPHADVAAAPPLPGALSRRSAHDANAAAPPPPPGALSRGSAPTLQRASGVKRGNLAQQTTAADKFFGSHTAVRHEREFLPAGIIHPGSPW